MYWKAEITMKAMMEGVLEGGKSNLVYFPGV